MWGCLVKSQPLLPEPNPPEEEEGDEHDQTPKEKKELENDDDDDGGGDAKKVEGRQQVLEDATRMEQGVFVLPVSIVDRLPPPTQRLRLLGMHRGSRDHRSTIKELGRRRFAIGPGRPHSIR